MEWIAIALLSYGGLVATFESLIGVAQPAGEGTLVITTMGEDGEARDRVLSRIDSDGRLYVAANHWPRAWYRRALSNPDVKVALDGPPAAYRAVPVRDEEHARIQAEHALPLVVRFLTGFPPRRFVRLEPAAGAARGHSPPLTLSTSPVTQAAAGEHR